MNYRLRVISKIIVILIILPGIDNAFATGQFPDQLRYKGKTLPLLSNPLEPLIDAKQLRSDNRLKGACSAIWRGYVATWKIRNEELFLIKMIEGTCEKNPPEILLPSLFDGQTSPMKASWYTGMLRVGIGNKLEHVHLGYKSVYDEELMIKVMNGKIVDQYLKKYGKGPSLKHLHPESSTTLLPSIATRIIGSEISERRARLSAKTGLVQRAEARKEQSETEEMALMMMSGKSDALKAEIEYLSLIQNEGNLRTQRALAKALVTTRITPLHYETRFSLSYSDNQPLTEKQLAANNILRWQLQELLWELEREINTDLE